MVFSSVLFIFIFLPITLSLYFILNKVGGIKYGNIILLIASLLFFWWGSGKDILILLLLIVVNYIAGLLLTAGNSGLLLSVEKKSFYQKSILFLCIVVSLGFLAYYKYAAFAASNVQSLLGLLGISWTVPAMVSSIILPLGISFYTFQALSYTLDVYYGNVEATPNIVRFALYVAFFPQLIAGPIVRYKDIYEQLNNRTITIGDVYHGAMRFMVGLVKKVLLANIVAKAADGLFSLPATELTTGLAWLGVVAYSLQIYLDFSAYSDMAIGLAKIMGFDLLENFNYPYRAKSVQDFWRRWHISLSSWFRDYLYIPLGGNRNGNARTYFNLLIVFFLCGLWHGAAWTFVLWGLWHGFFLIIERAFFGKILKKIPVFIGSVYTIVVVLIGWVLFRSETLSQAVAIIKTMFGFSQFSSQIIRSPLEYYQLDVIIATGFGLMVSLGFFKYIKKKLALYKNHSILEYVSAIVVVVLFCICIISMYSGAYNPFIYFRF